jgi:hypothetical protein
MIGIDFDAFFNNLSEAQKSVEDFLRLDRGSKYVTLASKAAIEVLKRNAPRSRRTTDHAADQFNFFVEKQGNETISNIFIEKGYGYLMFTDKGTPPHKIAGSPLAWKDERTNKTVFATFVNHPGNRAQRWVSRSMPVINVAIGLLQTKVKNEPQ